ncbi:YitT family protein [Rossellomorea oryzaecorticis]|uniref:YitT family protein n=1 Tax=Rossellomorea oryzaecorticis TaxID=1396505 RepID=A0ABW8VQR2_9BACI|nr:YitT family protein [[Bacillus] enclensis]MBH9965299.1 YitT family protein [[Bacillus] enclensis]
MNHLLKSVILFIASGIQGTAMAVFLFPHFIPSGGAASVSVLLNYLLHVPFSITLWVLNAGLLIAAVKWLGKSNALWTLYCVTVTSITVNLISPHMKAPLSNVIPDMGIGAVLFGIGIGILFRMGASSGGMDILALIISKLRDSSPGRPLFFINGSLLLLTGIVVDLKVIVYALICQFIGTKILDIIYKLEFRHRVPMLDSQNEGPSSML